MAEQVRDLSVYVNAPLLQSSEKPLSGNSAIITGATRPNGIGAAIAEAFASQGASPVILVGTSKSQELAAAVQRRLKRYNGDVYTLVGDVTKRVSCMEMMEAAYDWSGGNINILVNNAGVMSNQLVSEITEEDWDAIMRPKTLGATLMTSVWFGMRDALSIRGGRVIHIGSVIGRHGNFGQDIYAMANSALVGLTKSQSRELGRRGITVNLIEPGFVEGTDMTVEFDSDQLDVIKTVTALNLLVRTQDVAAAAAFLAGPGAERITGITLQVDSGMESNYTAPPRMHQAGFRKVPRQILSHVTGWPADLVDVIRRHGQSRNE